MIARLFDIGTFPRVVRASQDQHARILIHRRGNFVGARFISTHEICVVWHIRRNSQFLENVTDTRQRDRERKKDCKFIPATFDLDHILFNHSWSGQFVETCCLREGQETAKLV